MSLFLNLFCHVTASWLAYTDGHGAVVNWESLFFAVLQQNNALQCSLQ